MKEKTTDLEKFKKLFGYGDFRPYKNGLEVRVKELDNGFNLAKLIVEKNNLKLDVPINGRDVSLRSFLVNPK